MTGPDAPSPATEAQLRTAIEDISDRLGQVVEGRFDFEVAPALMDEAIQRLGTLINFLVQSTRNALSDMEKCAWELVAFDSMKSKFLTTVSHELRTPLTLILGPLHQLLQPGSDRDRLPREVVDSLERMRRSGARLLTLVDDLLDFGELEVGRVPVNWQPLDVTDLVTQIVEESRPVAESRGLSLRYSGDEGLGHVSLDPRLFEKIVLTLLGNALKFTPAGGGIEVSLRALGEELEFAVADTGIGIPEDKLSLMFQQFQQADAAASRSHEGLGLGLALVKQFAERMGGSVGVHTRMGEGSHFFVRLLMTGHLFLETEAGPPREAGPAQVMSRALYFHALHRPKSPRPSTPPVAPGPRPRVLLAEENPDMLAFITSVLAADYEVQTARNGKEAFDLLLRCAPDVILSEVMLPERSGIELLEQVKKDTELRSIPFILLTARAGKAAAVDGLEQGAEDYISKPFTPGELKARVRAAWRMRHLHKELLTHHRELAHKTQALEEALVREAETHRQLQLLSRQAGMAEVATGVLHNVGNILNSINVSASLLLDLVRKSKVAVLRRATDLLVQHAADLPGYLSSDEKGRHLPGFLVKVGEHLSGEQEALGREIDSMIQGLDRMKTVVAMQESYARKAGMAEELSTAELLDEVLGLHREDTKSAQIQIERSYEKVPRILVDRHKLLQILMNLIGNAIQALRSSDVRDRRLKASVKCSLPGRLHIGISDNGMGIPPDQLVKLFAFGAATSTDGHGLGLHSNANTAKEMGGSLTCSSEGVGHGATFTLDLPIGQKDRMA